MERLPVGLVELTKSLLGEYPVYAGRSFNLHYRSPNSFIKVTYPWVKGDRMKNEVLTSKYLESVGIDASVSLTSKPLTFEDEKGNERWATFWEPVDDIVAVAQETMTDYCTEKLREVSTLAIPEHFTRFSLDDFMDAVEKRMEVSDSELVPFLKREVEVVLDYLPDREGTVKFIHGDVHSGNVLVTSSGRVVLVDLESSCEGPVEWDAAQISRYSSIEDLLDLYKLYESWGLDVDLIRYFHHVRNLTSLTHMVASGATPPMYWKSLKELTEGSMQEI